MFLYIEVESYFNSLPHCIFCGWKLKITTIKSLVQTNIIHKLILGKDVLLWNQCFQVPSTGGIIYLQLGALFTFNWGHYLPSTGGIIYLQLGALFTFNWGHYLPCMTLAHNVIACLLVIVWLESQTLLHQLGN